jgi:membrane-bound lytic murein transglycosylase D
MMSTVKCAFVFLLASTFVAKGQVFALQRGPDAETKNESLIPGLAPVGPTIDGSEAETPFTKEDLDTPVTHQEIEGDRNLTSARPWRATDFTKQEGALGWTPTAFAIPRGLEVNVAFWLDIYTKYTTDQGVIHDQEHIDLIYETLDFTSIMMRTDINIFKKELMKTKRVKDAKERVKNLLQKLNDTTDPEGLNAEERKVWDYFAKFDNKKKFSEAMGKDRVRFQLGQRDRVIQGIFFSGRYLEDFEKVFKEAGLPLELSRLPFVESSFNVMARSKVGASGLWQIMPYTARGYMMMNKAIDKRNHPVEGARMAAKLLRGNFRMLGMWPLAVTGYNHGPTGVLRLTKIHKSKEIGDLFPRGAKKRLGFASRNFYASFMAIIEAERNAPKYFGNVQWSQPLASVDVKLPFAIKYTDVLRWFDGDDRRAQIFNPHITSDARKGKFPLPTGALISVPLFKKEQILGELRDPKSFRRLSDNR